MSSEEKTIWEASFNDAVTTYWLSNGIIILIVTVIGIPLLPFWIIGGKWITRKYLASHRATLTNRSLRVSKGIFTQIEKAVPLDRITDVGVVQGPLMRFFGVESLSVETAGQSAVGSLIHLTGVEEGRNFKEAILKQRDLVVGSNESGDKAVAVSNVDGSSAEVLQKILEVIERIESKMDSKE